jgi:hypothetical protein
VEAVGVPGARVSEPPTSQAGSVVSKQSWSVFEHPLMHLSQSCTFSVAVCGTQPKSKVTAAAPNFVAKLMLVWLDDDWGVDWVTPLSVKTAYASSSQATMWAEVALTVKYTSPSTHNHAARRWCGLSLSSSVSSAPLATPTCLVDASADVALAAAAPAGAPLAKAQVPAARSRAAASTPPGRFGYVIRFTRMSLILQCAPVQLSSTVGRHVLNVSQFCNDPQIFLTHIEDVPPYCTVRKPRSPGTVRSLASIIVYSDA